MHSEVQPPYLSIKDTSLTAGYRYRTVLSLSRQGSHTKDLVEHDNYTELTAKYDSLTKLTEPEWYSLLPGQFNTLFQFVHEIYRLTSDIHHPHADPERTKGMTAEYPSFHSHINIMEEIMLTYFDRSARFRQLFPPNTSPYFLRSLAWVHDFSRMCGLNGELPLHQVDGMSGKLMRHLLPAFPAEKNLHSIDSILGIKPKPDPKQQPVLLFMKLIDTTGKNPPRFPEELFQPGGQYERWLEYQIAQHRFPLYVPITNHKTRLDGNLTTSTQRYHIITAQEYAKNDREITLEAYNLIQSMFPEINYNEVLQTAATNEDAKQSIA